MRPPKKGDQVNDIKSYLAKMMDLLKTQPDHVYVEKDGSAIYGLAGPDLDHLLVITPPENKTFLDMTDEEINTHILEVLK
jgi:hypothetical protein